MPPPDTATSPLASTAERLADTTALDPAVDAVARAAGPLDTPGPVHEALAGAWLGHPAHPPLTDLPIGFWTTAAVLDLAGGRRARPAADLCVGLGILSALPTVATGLTDWFGQDRPGRRVGVVHAGANATAIGHYTASLVARRRGGRASGVMLGIAGAAAATVGGWLGGHLAFGSTGG